MTVHERAVAVPPVPLLVRTAFGIVQLSYASHTLDLRDF